MIAPDYLRRIAAWSRELNERETEIARAGIEDIAYVRQARVGKKLVKQR